MNTKWVVGILVAALTGAALFGTGFWVAQLVAIRQAPFSGPAALPWSGFFGHGMMGGGMMGGGAFGGFGRSPNVQPLTVDEATEAVENYLNRLGYQDLQVGEVMIFDNHAYVKVEDPAAGRGAFELLVDPVTRAVYPEYGPAMMWNVEYGMMGRRGRGGYGGMMGGMMAPFGGPRTPIPYDPASLTVTAEEAVQIAQDYLDDVFPGMTVADEVDAFPGYYTLHTLQDGQVVGMLSVHGYTGQVWYHFWHGTLLETSH